VILKKAYLYSLLNIKLKRDPAKGSIADLQDMECPLALDGHIIGKGFQWETIVVEKGEKEHRNGLLDDRRGKPTLII